MKLGYALMYVSDVETTMNFYEEAFSLKKGIFHESGQYGEMITGETKLGFVKNTLTTIPSSMVRVNFHPILWISGEQGAKYRSIAQEIAELNPRRSSPMRKWAIWKNLRNGGSDVR